MPILPFIGTIFVILGKSNVMKNVLLMIVIVVGFVACNTSYKNTSATKEEINNIDNDTVRIADEDSDYEIIIIEPGFNNWVAARAKPRGYYTQQFLESRNIIYVTEWNNRVLNPMAFNPQLYQMQINYDPSIDYGYEVNYLLYYYFIYFQRVYKQKLSGFVPRI